MRLLKLFGLTILLAFAFAGCEKKPALPLTSASDVPDSAPAVLV